MKLYGSSDSIKDSIGVSGGKHSFAHSIACGALAEEGLFENVPNITDSIVIMDILKNIFEVVQFDTKEYTLRFGTPFYPKEVVIDSEQLSKSRNIFCLLPALLNRAEKVVIVGVPTGCNIGERPTDWYYSILQNFGVEYNEEKNVITLSWREKKSAKIEFEYPTMTGTVIALACSGLIEGKTELSNCSVEPSCIDEIECMKELGITITGELPDVVIENPVRNGRVNYTCTCDRVYAVTLLTAAILARKKFKIYSISDIRIPQFVEFANNIGLNVLDNGNCIEIDWHDKSKPLNAVSLDAGSEPKFSSDWVTFALLILSTQTMGTSVIKDDVFLNRFQFVNFYDNKKNFDNVALSQSTTPGSRPFAIAEISGDYRKQIPGGNTVYCPDIRGSAAIVLSAIIASTPIEMSNQFQVSRGYENLIGTLIDIGFIQRR